MNKRFESHHLIWLCEAGIGAKQLKSLNERLAPQFSHFKK